MISNDKDIRMSQRSIFPKKWLKDAPSDTEKFPEHEVFIWMPKDASRFFHEDSQVWVSLNPPKFTPWDFRTNFVAKMVNYSSTKSILDLKVSLDRPCQDQNFDPGNNPIGVIPRALEQIRQIS